MLFRSMVTALLDINCPDDGTYTKTRPAPRNARANLEGDGLVEIEAKDFYRRKATSQPSSTLVPVAFRQRAGKRKDREGELVTAGPTIKELSSSLELPAKRFKMSGPRLTPDARTYCYCLLDDHFGLEKGDPILEHDRYCRHSDFECPWNWLKNERWW